MDQTLFDLGITISIFCDKTSVIHISKNLVMHSCAKKIAIKFHFIKEKVLANELCLINFISQDHVVDIFTNTLSKEVFERLRL
jgi:hypothetical protein